MNRRLKILSGYYLDTIEAAWQYALIQLICVYRVTNLVELILRIDYKTFTTVLKTH